MEFIRFTKMGGGWPAWMGRLHELAYPPTSKWKPPTLLEASKVGG